MLTHSLRLAAACLFMLGLVFTPITASTNGIRSPGSTAVETSEATLAIGAHPLKWQAKTPVHVVGVYFTASRIVQGALLFNAADSTITQIRLGYVVRQHANFATSRASLKVVEGDWIDIIVPNGKVVPLGPQAWRTEDALAAAEAAGSRDFFVEIGVVGARLANGTRFKYDLVAHQGFAVQRGTPAERLFASSVDEATLQTAAEAAFALSRANPAPPAVGKLTECDHCRCQEGTHCIPDLSGCGCFNTNCPGNPPHCNNKYCGTVSLC